MALSAACIFITRINRRYTFRYASQRFNIDGSLNFVPVTLETPNFFPSISNIVCSVISF
jgi:hypothetical protein